VTVTIVDVGTGNVGSVAAMMKRAGGSVELTSDPAVVERASKLLLPGVGSFDAAAAKLHAAKGLVEALNRQVLGRGVPVLGICLGMQLLAKDSEEGELQGLGWIAGRVTKLETDADAGGPRIPQMGWNTLSVQRSSPLLAGLADDARFYFAHSYRIECADPGDALATTTYGCEFTSVVQRENVYGTQFHPEKSHRHGMKVLSNFLEL